MRVGVDLRVLQVGHQYRGIGEVTKQCLNRIFVRALADGKSHPTFVFYEYNDRTDPKEYLSIPKGLTYEVIHLGSRPNTEGVVGKKERLITKWRLLFGAPVPYATMCDVFLQFQFELGVPKWPKTVLVVHDLIPYIFWDDYFESPWTHFRHYAARTTLRTLWHNFEYKHVLKRSHRAAARIVCVSESTRKDIHNYLHIPLKKMSVIHLGVSQKPTNTGKVAQKAKLPTKQFLLFVGGIDKRRRRVDDLIAAYNNLKAQGYDIQLALVGENFQTPEKIPDEVVRKAVKESSYAADILTLGYIDDETKQALYKKAIALVFPTIYEGFGIMILEAMLLGCPVIAYNNSSIPEVGREFAFYARGWKDIWQQVLVLLSMPKTERQTFIAKAKKHAEAFTWEKTAEKLYDEITTTQRKSSR